METSHSTILMKKGREGKATETQNSREILEEGRGQIIEINFDVQSEHLGGHTQVVFFFFFGPLCLRHSG